MAYADLLADIITWLNRDDLDTLAPKFVTLAEEHFNRVLRVPEMENVASATVDTGSITLPTDFLQVRSLFVSIDDTTDYSVSPQLVTIARLNELYPVAQVGAPVHYALQSGNEMVMSPAPDADTDASVVLNYYAKIPVLADDNTSNWLLASHYDLYLAAALVEGYTYARDTEGMAVWSARRDQKLAELRMQGIKKAYGGPLRARPQSTSTAYDRL